MTIRVTGLRELEVEMTRAAERMLPEVTAVVSKGALNVKKDWSARWKTEFSHKAAHAGRLPYDINYDVAPRPGGVSAEIGVDKSKKQGALGNIAEFGSPTSAPHPGGVPALEAEAPRFEAAMLAVTEKLLP